MNFKNLAQRIATTGGALDAVYTCPAGTQAKITLINFANVSTSNSRTVTCKIAPAGATDNGKHTILPVVTITANNALLLQFDDLYLQPGDVIRVAGSTVDIVTNIWGGEGPI